MLRVITASVYLLLLLLPPSLQAASGAVEKRKPNILLLLADDLGYNDSGLYQDVYQQVPVASMPALQSLAEEGVRFSRFYTESTCSASRVALLTGQYPARQGFIPVGRGISADVVTLPEYLQSQGYSTHHVGKWHMGEINREAYPAAQGFNTSFGFLSQWMLRGPDEAGQPQLKSPTYMDPWLMDEREHSRQYKGHLEDILTDHTLQKIREAKQRPWFIYHAFLAPHAPWEPEANMAKKFPSTPEGKYLALLAQLDHNLAKIFSALKSSGQWDDTIIIFASDNGSQNNGSQNKHANSNAPFSGGKANYDEGGIRAPLVIKWHAGFSGDKHLSDSPVSIMDIYASLRSLLDDKESAVTLDGKASLLPGSEKQPSPSLKYFYSFDGLSLFDATGRQRLLREWDREKFTRSELFHYDDHALPSMQVISFWQRLFFDADSQQEKLFTDFVQWRDGVRQVSVKVETGKDTSSDNISGSDFLRTPVNPSYALAFSVIPKKSREKQILLSQRGIMEVVLENGSLLATVHGMKVKAEGFVEGQCYRVVLSGAFYDRYSNVRETLLPSHLHLVIDGVLRDSTESAIESFAGLELATPHVAQGISPPRFFTTQLLPADKPLPSGMDSALHGLCE